MTLNFAWNEILGYAAMDTTSLIENLSMTPYFKFVPKWVLSGKVFEKVSRAHYMACANTTKQ